MSPCLRRAPLPLPQLPLLAHFQLSWAGWVHFGRARGKQCPGDGKKGTGKKRIPLLAPFHALGPGPHASVQGGAPSTWRCAVSHRIPGPRRKPPWLLLLYSTKVAASLPGSNLEKTQLIFRLLVRFSTKFNTLHVAFKIQALRA